MRQDHICVDLFDRLAEKVIGKKFIPFRQFLGLQTKIAGKPLPFGQK